MSTPSKGYDSWTPKLTAAQSAAFAACFPLFKYLLTADHADGDSMRCVHGLTAAPRCERKGEYLTLAKHGEWDGNAWCRDHRPVYKKGQWFVPARAVRVER